MTPQPAFINPLLLKDSHELLLLKNCAVRLHKNASLPWAIIIPETSEVEFCDLPQALLLSLTTTSRIISDFFKTNFGAEKINFAAIGNVVEQLHIHVIGRNPKDPLWPDVVWGRTLPDASYSEAELSLIKNQLINLLEAT